MGAFGSATLVLDGPAGSIKTEITGKRLSLGRTPDNDIVVADNAASSKHCEIYEDNGVLMLKDLGSSNGTFVNGQRVQSTPLWDGDIVRIGGSQGRITVLTLQGAPLRQAAARGPAVLVAVAVVLIAALGGAAVFVYVKHKNEERDRFADYDKKAHDLLTSAALSPCLGVSKLQLDFLAREDADEAELQLGDHGVLTSDQRDHDTALLKGVNQRVQQVKKIADQLNRVSASRAEKVSELKQLESLFSDEGLRAAVLALDKVYVEQGTITAQVAKDWSDYQSSLTEVSTLLDGLAHAADKDAAGVADKLSARLAHKPKPPAQIVEACEKGFKETKDTGMSQLAHALRF